MGVTHPTEEERLALCEGLTANGINPRTVPLRDSDLRIAVQDGQRVILYTEFVLDELTGNILAAPDGQVPVTSAASAPCLAEPPEWLNIPS
ncbi:hypothetical protein [Streptomyces sp. NBRC 110035]|uniref:hypothetical protein n=1 Tax=Streptomyces sp. NBRC 110035 TaxID=1547867 RepID=UPI0005A5DD41|nr:hypothetical protein [Streptomyces sp. NBRC 110035]